MFERRWVKQYILKTYFVFTEPFVASLTSINTDNNSTTIDSLLNFSTPAPSLPPTNSNHTTKMAAEKAALLEEPWFHGPISRQESEALVVRDGDFLVRESQNTPGQYVLTGMQRLMRKHLLLVDPEGVVSRLGFVWNVWIFFICMCDVFYYLFKCDMSCWVDRWNTKCGFAKNF